MDTSNPFATFLAARPETNPRSPSKVGSHLGKFSGFKIGETLVLGGSLDGLGLGTDEASDPFYSFLAQRPTHPTHEAEWLKAEVFRTKKQLLQVAVDAELKFISDQPSPEDATRLRRIKVAQRYLEHLELIGEPFSGAGTVVSEDGRSRPSTAGGEAKSGGVADGSAGSFGGAGGSIVAAVCEEVLEAPGGCEKRVHALTSSTSLPSILGGLGSPSVGSRVGTPTAASRSRFGTAATAMTGASLGSTLRTTGALSIGTNGLPKEEKEPLLEGWYSKTRSFNIQIGKGDLQCRRFSSAMPGGTFVLGNGRVPFFTGSHLLVKGYYFAFRVDQVDPKPPQGADLGYSLAIGISRMSPSHTRLRGSTSPLYAYEVPGAVILGYGGHFIDQGKWYKAPWDSNEVRAGDKVGVLITNDGEFVLYVNDEQVFRTGTTLGLGPKTTTKKSYYPIVDLCGKVSGLKLQPVTEPPNKPLEVARPLEPTVGK